MKDAGVHRLRRRVWRRLVELDELKPPRRPGSTLVAQERYQRADTSVTGQVLKIVAANPDAVLVAGSGTPAVLPQATLVERGYKGRIYQTHGVANRDFLRVGAKNVEGTIFPVGPILVAEQLPDSNASKKAAMEYIALYEKANGPNSRSTFGAHAWDAGLLLQRAVPEALKKAQPGTPEFRLALRDALENAKDVVATHGVFNMSPTDHQGLDARRAFWSRSRTATGSSSSSRPLSAMVADGQARLQPPRVRATRRRRHAEARWRLRAALAAGAGSLRAVHRRVSGPLGTSAPEQLFLAERGPDGGWRELSYGDALGRVRAIGQALLRRRLSVERPVVILSDNSIDHALLALAAMHVGVPVAPVSPSYSLASRDFAKLKHIVALLTPGLIFVQDAGKFAPALAAVNSGNAEVVAGRSASGLRTTPFARLVATKPRPQVDNAYRRVGPDTIAKILFTSGSTDLPKGVINTQRMLCANQQAIAQIWPFLAEKLPVIVDWLPWSHTFGGNHNFNMMLRHGGTVYVDEGKPAPGLVERTVANLGEISPTIYFNVPRGYDMLLPHLESNAALRANFFRRLDLIFYAAAALPQNLWERLEDIAVAARGNASAWFRRGDRPRPRRSSRRCISRWSARASSDCPCRVWTSRWCPMPARWSCACVVPTSRPGISSARISPRQRSTTKVITGSATPGASPTRTTRSRASSSMGASPRTSSCSPGRGSTSAHCASRLSQPGLRSSRTACSPATTARRSAC